MYLSFTDYCLTHKVIKLSNNPSERSGLHMMEQGQTLKACLRCVEKEPKSLKSPLLTHCLHVSSIDLRSHGWYPVADRKAMQAHMEVQFQHCSPFLSQLQRTAVERQRPLGSAQDCSLGLWMELS